VSFSNWVAFTLPTGGEQISLVNIQITRLLNEVQVSTQSIKLVSLGPLFHKFCSQPVLRLLIPLSTATIPEGKPQWSLLGERNERLFIKVTHNVIETKIYIFRNPGVCFGARGSVHGSVHLIPGVSIETQGYTLRQRINNNQTDE